MDFWDYMGLLLGACVLAFILGAASFVSHQRDKYTEELASHGNLIIKLDEIRLECVEK